MYKRLLFNTLVKYLPEKHILLIIGARQTGKTTLMHQLIAELKQRNENTFFLTMEDQRIRAELDQHPENLFLVLPPINNKVRNYIFIDEVQYLSNPSNFLKYHFDLNQDFLKFIVSGSSSFYIDQKFTDSLAGRKRLFELNSLSFNEFLIFKGRNDFADYLDSGTIPLLYKNEIQRMLMEYILYGGYPEVVVSENYEEKKVILDELANSYVKKDALESKLNNPELYFQILQVLAYQAGSLTNVSEIGRDLKTSSQTIENYIKVMKMAFQVTQIHPFSRNISTEIRKMPKTYFNDLGLRNYFVRDFSPLHLRNDNGALFENFVFRLLSDRYDGSDIQFWRTQKMQEVDFVVENKHAFEVKYSPKQVNQKKYEYFTKAYPDINLNFVTFENVLEIMTPMMKVNP